MSSQYRHHDTHCAHGRARTHTHTHTHICTHAYSHTHTHTHTHTQTPTVHAHTYIHKRLESDREQPGRQTGKDYPKMQTDIPEQPEDTV